MVRVAGCWLVTLKGSLPIKNYFQLSSYHVCLYKKLATVNVIKLNGSDKKWNLYVMIIHLHVILEYLLSHPNSTKLNSSWSDNVIGLNSTQHNPTPTPEIFLTLPRYLNKCWPRRLACAMRACVHGWR